MLHNEAMNMKGGSFHAQPSGRKFGCSPALFAVFFIVLLASNCFGALPGVQAWSSSPSAPASPGNLVSSGESSRRDVLRNTFLATGSFLALPLSGAFAAEEESGMMSTSAVASLLHEVPTFAIVDKQGVPFMVVGEDAKVTGYFFTSFEEADRILKVAVKSADKAIRQARAEGKSEEEVGTNPWKMARISAIPLDSAVTLVTRSSASVGAGNYFRVAPAEKDVEDALKITGQEDLAEGKVPLFYYEKFQVDVDGIPRSPLYFRKSELEEQFRKNNRGVAPPPVLVTELFAVLAQMVKPGVTDADLKSLIFVPPKESDKRRKDCEKASGGEAPYVVGKRIIVL